MLIALKMKAAVLGTVLGAAMAAPLLASAVAPSPRQALDGAVVVAPGSFNYRAAGDFSRNGKPAGSPLREIRIRRGLVVMKNLVTAAEYTRCMADGACPRVAMRAEARDVPVVGVSWHDATAYAAWISRKTGVTHRLPTDMEWAFAAAEKARDEPLPLIDPADPAQAWIARYEAEAAREKSEAAGPQPVGSFGINSKGLADVGGNVWEWTNSCFVRVSLDGGNERVTNTNCGVRVVEGAHRTYMTDFIRDPRTGGCAAGTPPANLGFRLVTEEPSAFTAMIEQTAARLGLRS